MEAAGDGGMMLALTPTEGEPKGSVEATMGVDEGTTGGKRPGGVEESEQMVVVTLTTVVDVWTTVALAGQLTASDAHLVTVYVDVARTTVVTMSLSARSTSGEASAMLVPQQEPGHCEAKPPTWSGHGQDSRHGASEEGGKPEHLHGEEAASSVKGREGKGTCGRAVGETEGAANECRRGRAVEQMKGTRWRLYWEEATGAKSSHRPCSAGREGAYPRLHRRRAAGGRRTGGMAWHHVPCLSPGEPQGN